MLDPERNEVNISQLFKWGKKVDIFDISNSILMSCYIRLVGDADMNRSRVFALRRSAELRKKLRNPDSDERLAYIEDKEMSTKEQLIKYVLILENKNFINEAYQTTKVEFPKEPAEGASLEDQEKYQKEIDEFRTKLDNEIGKTVEKLAKTEETKVSKLNESELYNRYEELSINELCQTEMLNSFRDACIYFGSYADEAYKTRLFKSVDEFQELPSDLKKQFESEYDTLEINMEVLKKSPGAMLL